jgi:phage FluMu protein Com
MIVREKKFILPLGYEDENDVIYREGTMRMATALDEIEIQNDDRSGLNIRFRDCMMLSRVITSLGEIKSITPEIIENLFEVDFIYLQMFYNRFNRDNEDAILLRCPNCKAINKVPMPDLFKEMHQYFIEKNTEKKTVASIEEIK